MPKPTVEKSEEVITIPTISEFQKNNQEACRARLLECMSAPKLEQTLENGYIHDNLDELHRLTEELGRRRDRRYYFTDGKYPKCFMGGKNETTKKKE